jgi:hypothetical protein
MHVAQSLRAPVIGELMILPIDLEAAVLGWAGNHATSQGPGHPAGPWSPITSPGHLARPLRVVYDAGLRVGP